MANIWTRRILTALLLMVVAVWLANNVLIPVTAERILSAHLRAVYAEQSNIFTPAISSLGVTNAPTQYFNCGNQSLTRWRTDMRCQAYQNYPWTFSPISAATKAAWPKAAAKFDELLRRNDWLNDRPQDTVITVAGSNPDLAGNGGIGGQVSFHKNIGSGANFISCSLEIDVQGYWQSSVSVNPPWTVNVNVFSCSQRLSFFDFHWQNYQHRGV